MKRKRNYQQVFVKFSQPIQPEQPSEEIKTCNPTGAIKERKAGRTILGLVCLTKTHFRQTVSG